MDYKVIKVKVENKKVELRDSRASLQRDKNALENLKNDIEVIKRNKEFEITKEKSAQLKDLQDKATLVIRNEIVVLEQKRLDAKEAKKKTIADMKIEDYQKAYQYKLSGLDDVMVSVENVPELAKKYLDERLYNVINDNINNKSTKLVTDDLNIIVDRMNSLQGKLDGVDYSRFLDWNNIIEKLFSSINPEKFEKSGTIVIYIIVWVVIMFFTSKFLFPVLFILFTALFCYNIIKSKNIMKAMKIAKAVTDNRQQILDSVNRSIKEHMEDDRKEYEAEYDKVDKDLLTLINTKQEEVNNICRQVANNFIYDGTALEQRFENKLLNMKQQCTSLEKEISEKETKVQELTEELGNLNKELEASMATVVDCYTSFDYKKEELLIDPEFLVDVENNEPVFYHHPLTSMFYLYKDLEECIAFIKLLMVESMIRMNLRCYKPYIIDKTYMCSHFGAFQHDKWDKAKYMNFSTNDTEVREVLTELNEKLQKRLRLFGGVSIEKYNEEKIRTESIPENYLWVFLIDPDISLLNSQELRQLMVVGHKYGIYINIFVSYDIFTRDNKSFLQTVSSVGNAARITSGMIQPQTIESVKKLCLK